MFAWHIVVVATSCIVSVVKAEAETLPLLVAPEVINATNTQSCPSQEVLEAARSQLTTRVQELLSSTFAPDTCGSSAWTRVAYLDMSDTTQSCPSAWRLFTSPRRACGKFSGPRCDGVNYDTNGMTYTQVCGRIIAFPQSTVQAFRGALRDIDDFYVDGVSLTHGQPRQHIWSFVAGFYPLGSATFKCPCDGGDQTIPSFVGSSYFCEGSLENVPGSDTASVLWDGEGCLPSSTCCSFNSPPWFTVTLPAPTNDNIEVRICSGDTLNGGFNTENTPVSLIEIFVK